ncbi:MAG: GNAT family N-acetyltransferase [Kiritimatiellae bacterium]|nr:GNAT family N-acetyltransferase [Kiritimatiellia bacterium]
MVNAVKIRIHRAEACDAAVLAGLNAEFNEVRMPIALIKKRVRTNRKELVLLADVSGDVAGYACVQFSRSMCYQDDWAEITEMYVRDRFRRMGVGTALLSAAERGAAQRKVYQFVVLTGGRNRKGQALYSSAGYRKTRELVYTKDAANQQIHTIAAKRGSA